VLIAVVLPAAGTLNINNVKEESIDADDIPVVVFGNSPTIGDTNRDWLIVATYPIPESASGLAYDGANLYCGIYGANGDEVYQIDPSTGGYQLKFTGPQEDAFGLTYDGQYLWTTDHPGSSSTPAVAMQLDMNGNLISQFDLPDHYMSGIAYDYGDFWVATYYPDPATIYKVDGTGSILRQFTAPDDQPWDLCLENNNIWMADYWGDTLYKIDPSDGSLLESHASEGVDPAGIVWDGAYLWYCDNGVDYTDDYLYKVDLAGAGTPEIYVPITSHDYGVVTVGDSATWDATVENIGTADLVIQDVAFTGTGSNDLSCPLTFPVTINPDDQTQIPLVYEPQDAGELDAIATIESNDPVNPTVDITLTGNAVIPGNPPGMPTIVGQLNGNAGQSYDYTFNAVDPDGDDVKYHIDWDDGDSDTTAFSPSGTNVTVSHIWSDEGTYTIKATAEDTYGLVGPEGTLEVTMPRNKATYNLLFLRFLEQFPILRLLLQRLGLQ